MSEAELIASIKELANDPRRRTALAQKLTDLLGQPPPESLPTRATRKAVQDAEGQMGFPLPLLLRELWTEVGNGGFGPGYGLFGVSVTPGSELSMSVPNVYLQSIADESYGWPKKLVLICEWGCALYSAIDCSTCDGEIVNVLGELDLKPTGSSLAQWMQDWVDGVDLWQRDFSDRGQTPVETET
jgi:hypothetical protein